MRCNPGTPGGTTLALLTGGLLIAATPSFAQYQNSSPSSDTNAAQPAAQPGAAQPSAAPDQSTPSTTNAADSSTSTMQSPDQANSSATMSASASEPLSKVRHAKTTLASATVQDSSGQTIGQVTSVHTTKHGTPTTIDVSLQSNSAGQAKVVAIKASKLRYDSSSNTLKAKLTSSDVQSLPAASSM